MKTLERHLGLMAVIAISIAAMLGSGLFVLPGLAAGQTGPSIWLAYLVAGLCVVPAALSKAELATAMPESGGTYVYVDRTFGPLAGTVAGLALWLSLLLKSAFALVGFGAYLKVLAPVPLKSVSVGLLVGIVALNVVGVRWVGKVQSWIVGAAIATLAVIAVRGLGGFDRALLEPSFAQGLGGFWGTVSFVYISYAGVTKVAAIAEEVKNPERNLPIGILASLGMVTVLYSVVTLILVGNVPAASLGDDLHPIYTLGASLSPGLGVVAAVLGVLTMTSMSNSGLLAASRFPFAMARNRLMPSRLSYVSTRFTTPVPAILLTGSLMGIVIVALDVEAIAKLASALMIAGYMAVSIVVLVLREGAVQWYKPSFRSPLYPAMQVIGILLGIVLLAMLGWTSVVALVSIGVPGLLLYFGFGRHQTDRLGVVGQLGPRRELLASSVASTELPDKASVVVPLLGRAYGAEALAELGAALGGGGRVEVLHVRDVPESIALDANLEDPVVGSLRRRLAKLSQSKGGAIDFDALATHDHVRTVHEVSRQLQCEWLLMEWHRHSERGVLPFNPLGWLVDHLACNLAVFKDVGSRYVGSILVYPEPGPHDALVALTADHLARVHAAELTFVRHVHERADAAAVADAEAYLDQLRSLCSESTRSRIVRGTSGVDAIAGLTAEYDLLVMGAPPDLRFPISLQGRPADRLMRKSACSVLRLKAPRQLLDRRASRAVPSQDAPIRIDDHLLGGCVGARLPVMSKQALFAHFARTFSRALSDCDAERIEDGLWDRERTQSTALGNGLAVPHATVEGLERSHVGVFTTGGPVDYRAPDGGPVDVFFVTVGPPSDRNTHLRILSGLGWLVTKTRFLEGVRAADNAQELLAVLLASSTLHARPAERPTDESGSGGEDGEDAGPSEEAPRPGDVPSE